MYRNIDENKLKFMKNTANNANKNNCKNHII